MTNIDFNNKAIFCNKLHGIAEPNSKTPNGRAFISNEYPTSRSITKTRFIPGMQPGTGTYETYSEQSKTIPKNFLDSHSIGNYSWVFEIKNGITGYVKQK